MHSSGVIQSSLSVLQPHPFSSYVMSLQALGNEAMQLLGLLADVGARALPAFD